MSRRYENKEFCKSVKCSKLSKDGTKCEDTLCVRTAKEFHHWLNENNFCIRKCEIGVKD
jgi:hypothetical protein